MVQRHPHHIVVFAKNLIALKTVEVKIILTNCQPIFYLHFTSHYFIAIALDRKGLRITDKTSGEFST